MIFWFSATRCGRAAVLFFTSQHVSLSLETATQPASSICLNQFSVGCSSYCSVSGNKTHAGEQAHQEDEFFFFEHASALCTLVQRAPLSLFNLDTEPGVEAFSTAHHHHVALTFAFPLRHKELRWNESWSSARQLYTSQKELLCGVKIRRNFPAVIL